MTRLRRDELDAVAAGKLPVVGGGAWITPTYSFFDPSAVAAAHYLARHPDDARERFDVLKSFASWCREAGLLDCFQASPSQLEAYAYQLTRQGFTDELRAFHLDVIAGFVDQGRADGYFAVWQADLEARQRRLAAELARYAADQSGVSP